MAEAEGLIFVRGETDGDICDTCFSNEWVAVGWIEVFLGFHHRVNQPKILPKGVRGGPCYETYDVEL